MNTAVQSRAFNPREPIMAGAKVSGKLDYLPTLPRNRRVGIGCIGSGFIMADCHLVSYRSAGLNPVAIASRRVKNAKSVAKRHGIASVYPTYQDLLADQRVEVVDIAVPPDVQVEVIREAAGHPHIRGILVQKPIAMNYAQAKQVVDLCRQAKKTLCVNQNMRYDQSIRACKCLLHRGTLGEPVLATIDMRAIPHWMPWQKRLGWLTCRIMSIHHLDTMRYWFGDPTRVYASFRSDPRTAKQFSHSDGICLMILEYSGGLRCMICDDVWTGPALEGAASDIGIHWRVEGTEGLARGSIGWPSYPKPTPSTIDYTSISTGKWHKPRWKKVWFPDAFVGPMAELLCALEQGRQPSLSGADNLKTMALVDACYQSARTHRSVTIREITQKK